MLFDTVSMSKDNMLTIMARQFARDFATRPCHWGAAPCSLYPPHARPSSRLIVSSSRTRYYFHRVWRCCSPPATHELGVGLSLSCEFAEYNLPMGHTVSSLTPPPFIPTQVQAGRHLKRIVVLLQEAGDFVRHAAGEVLDDELVALHPGLLVVGVWVAPVVLLGFERFRGEGERERHRIKEEEEREKEREGEGKGEEREGGRIRSRGHR